VLSTLARFVPIGAPSMQVDLKVSSAAVDGEGRLADGESGRGVGH
jgi:hypothetical protein